MSGRPREDFGSDVIRGSNFGRHVLDLVVVAGETEINNLELTISGGLSEGRIVDEARREWMRQAAGSCYRCKEEILWLEIAMADVVDSVAIF